MNKTWTVLVVGALALAGWSAALGSITLQTVTVGNPGNPPDMRYEYAGVGGVGYTFQMGRYEITTSQYVSFLNAVADADTYGLYWTEMGSLTPYWGCNIQRTGFSGNYSYTVGNGSPDDVTDWGNRPVNYVTWANAARFANWMHNGQPTGDQNLTTTEDGSYYLNGATSYWDLEYVTRQSDATWVIPNEDEWYKAAYHKKDGVTGNYWDYPTGTDTPPNNGNPEGDTGNSANYYDVYDYTVGAPFWRSNVGYFGQSDSPYGTFDQGGNVWEWNEGILHPYAPNHILRGGAFFEPIGVGSLHAGCSESLIPMGDGFGIGFRLALVPEPATAVLLALIGLAMLRRR